MWWTEKPAYSTRLNGSDVSDAPVWEPVVILHKQPNL